MPESQSVCATDPPPPALLRRWGLAGAEATAPGRWRARGAGAEYLLRRHAAPDRKRIVFRHGLTAALDASGLPVLAPVPARTGRTLVTSGGAGYELFPWVTGRRREGLELTYGQCERLGELLGALHVALDEHTPPVQQTMLLPTPRAADAVARAEELLGAVPDDGTDFAALTARRLRERLALLAEFADFRPPELDSSLVGHLHGAFGPGCLRYGGSGNVTAVLGWDGLTTGPVAGEVVRAAVALFAAPDERGLDAERVQAFVRGHRSMFPLDPEQLQSAVHRTWWELLCDVAPLRHRAPGGRGAAALAAWWSERLDLTLELFPAPYTAPPVESPAYG
ncbi:phosphotransferase enzyme family protein [Actinomadura parmotrematis]|uniref:Phosphotransferase n=1 Tax=Actinomadura parmotrematis TaxID=2864039 RepID=A0ABS7G0S5_9ACTN|nr:phosphotransferase [Actinomadura parmotrematis]MBW8486151.1 phosphotransferase [Actinomadura parmotrematis]